METVLTLARHGETRENAEGRWQGRSDSPLTAEGRRQALALAERVKARSPYQAIYASPLGRALETARLIALTLGGLLFHPEVRLTEYDFGGWDGLTPAELRARGFWEEVNRDPEFAPPGGEAFAEAARRVSAALRGLAGEHRGKRLILVGHGLSLAAGLALLLEGDPRSAPRYALGNGGIAELAVGSSVRVIHIDPAVSCELE